MVNDSGHLAIKYRPVSLDDVVGQETAVRTIRGMLRRGKFPSTILIAGPWSTGKTTLARLIALYSCCLDPTKDGEPCGKCRSCAPMLKMIRARSEHPDVLEINAALDRGIEQIRSLQSLAQLAPTMKYRIFILDEAHQITDTAFKGALKLLEEPPPRTKFILCTTNPEKLPKEIISRSQNLILPSISPIVVAKRLFGIAKKEGLKADDKVLKKLCIELATSTGGHIRDTLGALDNVINFVEGGGDVAKSISAESLQDLIEKATADAPYILVQKYLSALLEGHREKVFYAVKQVQNPEYFTRSVLEAWQQIMYRWISQSLVDKDRFWTLKNIKGIPNQEFGRALLDDTTDVEDILETMTSALERIKGYTTDPVTVLHIATLRCLRIMDKWYSKK